MESINNYELAERNVRFFAQMIDMFIMALIAAPIAYLAYINGYIILSKPPVISWQYQLSSSVISIIFYFAINYKLLKNNGQTIGKKLLNIKIVRDDNQPVSFTDLLLKRYSVYWLLPMIPMIGGILSTINYLMIFGKQRKCFHDRVAGTKVVFV